MDHDPILASMLSEATALRRTGALAAAVAHYQRILASYPSHPEALYGLAVISCQQGRFDAGADLAQQALAASPRDPRIHLLLGRASAELGNLPQALACLDRAIAIDPTSSEALGHRGDLLAQCGRLEEAVDSYRRALAIAPGSPENWLNLGAALADLGSHEDAITAYQRVIDLEPGLAEAHFNRATVLARVGRNAEALASLESGLMLSPDHIAALVSHGELLRDAGRHAQALARYDHALAQAPQHAAALAGRAAVLVALGRHAEALASLDGLISLGAGDADAFSNRAFLLHALGRFDEAMVSVDRALALAPGHVEAMVNRGVLLSDLGRHADAVASYDRALAGAPGHLRAHCNRAKALFALDRHEAALTGMDRALAIDPAYVEAHYTRGLALGRLRRYDEAMAAFERVLELAPAHPHALAQLVTSSRAICAFAQSASHAGRLLGAMASGTAVVAPHILLQLATDPATALAGARRYMEREIPAGPPLDAAGARPAHDKLRVAYLCGDFRVHPVAYLTAELFERHDRSRFDVIGISIGPDDRSDLRTRIARSFDQFQDVRHVSDREIAALIRRLGIDIAVDLSGHTDNARPGILQYRPAPIQVNYLGYPGTMGAEYYDYIIADTVTLPFDQQPHYVERIVHLPDCFLANDTTRPIALQPSRAAAGLPPSGFVFCCFNNAYKISPEIFHVWMQLLADVSASVLWLSDLDRRARDNLCAAAAADGIDPSRILFAPRLPAMADHLARQRLADLFLDTPGYNAHTTASDALWAGLPLLTCMGATFPGRVAASLLRSIGLPDLVVTSLDDYAALALKLARDPPALAAIRQRLQQNRATHPLFDSGRFRRHIEHAYATMAAHHRQGLRPASFAVPPFES